MFGLNPRRYKMTHLKTEKILEYIANRIGDEEAFEVDNHLAVCQECARRVRVHRYIKDHFGEVWNTWTSKDYVEEYWQTRISEALFSEKVPARLGQKVKEWVGKIKRKTDFAVGVIIDASKQQAKVVQEGMDFLREPGGLFNFVAAHDFLRTRGARRTRGAAEAGPISVKAQGPPWAKITVEPSVNKITVQMEKTEQPWPLLLLLSKRKGQEFITDFHEDKEANCLSAEFENIPNGEYVLLSEPKT
jgi:hypothetical protein